MNQKLFHCLLKFGFPMWLSRVIMIAYSPLSFISHCYCVHWNNRQDSWFGIPTVVLAWHLCCIDTIQCTFSMHHILKHTYFEATVALTNAQQWLKMHSQNLRHISDHLMPVCWLVTVIVTCANQRHMIHGDRTESISFKLSSTCWWHTGTHLDTWQLKLDVQRVSDRVSSLSIVIV